jgi:hypothetical protein
MNPFVMKLHSGEQYSCTKIESRGAMVSTIYVAESVLEIWEMINKIKCHKLILKPPKNSNTINRMKILNN